MNILSQKKRLALEVDIPGMPSPKLDNIEIVEPPIEELSKKRHTFLRSCFFSIVLMFLLLCASTVGLWLSLGTGPKTLSKVPTNFPADVPIYDQDNIENITFITGRYKNRALEISAFLPKIILSSLLSKYHNDPSDPDSKNQPKNIWQAMMMPVGDKRDSIQIEWRDSDTSATFLMSYYKNELKKKSFSIDSETDGKNFKQTNFSRASDNISGAIYAEWSEENRSRSSYILLTINAFMELPNDSTSTVK